MVYYAIGADVAEDYYAGYNFLPPFDISSLGPFMICLVLLSATLIYKLIASKALKEILQKRGLFFWGIVFMDIALLLNGAFSPDWRAENLLFGALSAFVLTLFYCLFLTVIARSKDGVAYACKTLLATGFAVSAQILVIAYRLHLNDNLIVEMSSGVERINRVMLSMPWGLPTIVGAVIAITIPAALYLARSHRCPVFYYLAAVFLWLMTVFIDTRSAILFGGIVLLTGIIFCCISSMCETMHFK